MEKKWRLQPKAPQEFIDKFPEYNPVVLELLWSRGLKAQKEIDEFFSPDYDEDLHDPFLFKGMRKAVKRVKEALNKKEKVLIYGDYDHDGICGSAMLYLFFKELGVTPDIYIPDRLKDGYGLNMKAIGEIIKRGINILITVDCGVSDYREVKKATDAGIDVIILDHHLIHGKFPSAFAVINAKQKSDRYPFKELAGVGVAFKFVQAMIRSLPDRKFNDGLEKWFLDLVAIGTVGDIVPLVGENRTLVNYGLVVLAQTRRLGLKELMAIAGVIPRLQKNIKSECKLPITNLDTHTLGFIIVPRINAAGRMDHANTAFELLITDLKEEAESLARRLNETNRDRQDLVERIYKEIDKRLDGRKLPQVIVEGDKDWSRGVVGLVASRIVDKYSRPAFVFCEESKENVGSCRSIPEFNLVEAMESCQDLFEEFGGHRTAGGFTIFNKNLAKFKKCINDVADMKIKETDLTPKLDIDFEISPGDINWDFFEELDRFKPFGEANPRPLFLMKNLEIAGLRGVGQNGKHFQLRLKSVSADGESVKNFKAIYFNVEDGKKNLKVGDRIDVVFELVADEWNGLRELRLKVADLKK